MEAIEVRATIIDPVPRVGKHAKQWRVFWDDYYGGRNGVKCLTFNTREAAERAACNWSKYHRTYVQEV